MPVNIQQDGRVVINRQTSTVTISTAGTPGASHDTWIYNQTTPLAVWEFNHPFEGHYPSVTITDLNGVIVHAAVEYPSSQSIRVTFLAPFAGRALIN